MIDPFSWIATGAQTLTSLAIANKNYQSQKETNAANERSVAATNAANERMVAATNAANVEQANLSYERSKPITQVANMMDAGMSKAGALNALSGGGVYTPPALSTATAQSSTQQAPHFDYSGIAQAIDRFSNIPSSQNQLEIQHQQLADLKQQAAIRQKEELRKQEAHDLDMWQKHYGKNTAELLDAFSSKVVQTAAEKNYDLSQAKTSEQIIRDLGLSSDRDYKKMPHLARVQLFDAIKAQNDQRIAQEVHESNMEHAQDAHDLAELQKVIQRINVKYYDKEKNESLLNLMRSGQGIIQDNNIKFADLQAKDMENMVREAGIDNERQARQLAEYVNKLSQEDEIDIAYKRASANRNTLGVHNQFRVLLRDLGELLMKVKL